MKKSKGKKLFPQPQGITTADLHFRLCHSCLHLNESEQEIMQCQICKKFLTLGPLLNQKILVDKAASGYEDGHEEEDELYEEEMDGEGAGFKRAVGLHGLSVIW